MDYEKQQYVETFLHIVRGSKSKNDFLKNVQQFDNKFTQTYQTPASFQNKASYESFQSAQQIEQPQKPKNPFISQNEDNVKRSYSPSRSNNFISQQQQPPYYNNHGNNLPANKMNTASRTEQDFFKPTQAAKTFHAGFNQKEYQRPSYNQQFSGQMPKGPNFAWQNSQPFNQPPQYANQPPQYINQQPPQFINQPPQYIAPQNYYEQQMKQNYNEMMKNFTNFAMNDQQKYNNDLSINSRQNLTPQNSGLDHPNQFLAAFSKQEDGPERFYKAPIPYPPKQEGQNTRPYVDKRTNPFAMQ